MLACRESHSWLDSLAQEEFDMPYRVLPSGVTECDTIDEVLALQRAIAQQPSPSPEPEPSPPVATAANFRGFWRKLTDPAKDVLRALASGNCEPMFGPTLAKRCSMSTQKLPGVMVHIRHTANRHAVDEPVIRTQRTVNGKTKSFYQLSKELAVELERELQEGGAERFDLVADRT
jgi:hypothetical protein